MKNMYVFSNLFYCIYSKNTQINAMSRVGICIYFLFYLWSLYTVRWEKSLCSKICPFKSARVRQSSPILSYDNLIFMYLCVRMFVGDGRGYRYSFFTERTMSVVFT